MSTLRFIIFRLYYFVVATIVLVIDSGFLSAEVTKADAANTLVQNESSSETVLAMKNSAGNLAVIAKALAYWQLDNKPNLPLYCLKTRDGEPGLSWRVALLPMLGEDQLYSKFKLDEAWDSQSNKRLMAEMPEVYRSPRHESRRGFTNYLAVGGEQSFFRHTGRSRVGSCNDGTSNTISVIEVDRANSMVWTSPQDFNWNRDNPNEGIGVRGEQNNFLFALADTSVHLLPRETNSSTLEGMYVCNDGRVLGLESLLPEIKKRPYLYCRGRRDDSVPGFLREESSELPADISQDSNSFKNDSKTKTYFALVRSNLEDDELAVSFIEPDDGLEIKVLRIEAGAMWFTINHTSESDKNWWQIIIRTPYGLPLRPKEYRLSSPLSDYVLSQPALQLTSNTSPKVTGRGYFKVYEVAFESDDSTLLSFSVDFELFDKSSKQILNGYLRYYANIDPEPSDKDIAEALSQYKRRR